MGRPWVHSIIAPIIIKFCFEIGCERCIKINILNAMSADISVTYDWKVSVIRK